MRRTAWSMAIVLMSSTAQADVPAAAAGAAAHGEAPAVATPAKTPDEVKRGYWFYKKPPDPPPEDEAAEKPPEEKPKQLAMTAPPPEADLLKLPVKNVEKMIEDYREYALYTMEPEKVRWYYQMLDFARRRSRAFMNVTEVVMLNNPQLNMNTEYPTNVPGSNARLQRRDTTIQTRLQSEQQNAALVMLTSQGCGYCEAQRGILKFFQQKYGWPVREVDIQQHPEAVTRFGTSSTPSVFLIVKDSADWMPVAVGVESLPKVEENSYRALRMLRGETSAQQWTTNEFEDGGMLDPQRK